MPLGYRAIGAALKKIPIQSGDIQFIDFGCGKGRAVIVAATKGYAWAAGIVFHLLALERLLAKEGVVTLDLTHGGDPWKDIFANDFDLVHELIIHKSTAVCWLSKVRRNMLSPVKRSIIRLVG